MKKPKRPKRKRLMTLVGMIILLAPTLTAEITRAPDGATTVKVVVTGKGAPDADAK